MGIFGALTTAVTGMRAQSFALENVSGNIANSQTTAFKRLDTSFVDLIPDEQPSKQLAGSVIANSRMTNTVQGDIQAASIGTFMAINGDGFFVVEKPSNVVDNQPVFSGIDRYTRRGDFQPDKNGYLVNGAGYFLMGIPVDPTTGNLVGSVPEVLRFQNDFLPAQATSQIEYRANLASYPLTPDHDTDIPGSELLNPATFSRNPIAGAPIAAQITGAGAQLADVIAGVTGTGTFANPGVDTLGPDAGTLRIVVTPSGGGATPYDVMLNAGDTLNSIVAAINGTLGLSTAITATIDTTGGTNKLRLDADSADYSFAIDPFSTDLLTTRLGLAETSHASSNLLNKGISQGETLTVDVGGTTTQFVFGTGATEISTIAELSAEIGLYPPAMGTASVDANGNLTFTASGTNPITVDPSATATKFGINVFEALHANGTVIGQDLSPFLGQSVGGGAVTCYDISGSPVNIQLRWAKVESALYPGGTDTWNLFYQVNPNATGQQVAWQNVGVNYMFGPNGQMNPVIGTLTLTNVTVNGISLGNVQLVHGSGGITQFADPNGGVQVNLLQQNGFPAGELQQVAVSDNGRIIGTYSNGRTLDLAEITLANFNGANYLKRIDGGAFEVTDESGTPNYGAPGKIIGSSLEGSNTDIADEFTKLIVTQQAYSANTRVITTSNQMVQDLLNMLR
jgi:flagellar hook protein FlgE